MPFIKVNGINMFYEQSGTGEPVLFIHGLGSSTIDWEYQSPYFAKEYQVTAIDLRGHGQTDKPKSPYSIKLFADDVAEFIKSPVLNKKPNNIVGISMGGMVALQLAVDYPELINSIVIANSLADFKLKNLSEKYQYFQRTLIVRFLGMHKMGELIAAKMFPDEKFAEIRKTFAQRWAKNDKRDYLYSMNAIVNWSVADSLSKISCSSLILTADQDYSSVEEKRVLANKIKNSELVILKNSRHGSPVDQTVKFNAAIDSFLKELSNNAHMV